MTQKRLTLGNVAVAAGVSQMTVSRVLRSKGVVSERTRQHVLKVVDDLGYVQNQLAGSLATSRSNQVAVIIPSLVNNVFTEVVTGITTELEKAGYNAVVGISDYSLQKEEDLIYSMMSWRPAGIIVPNIFHTPKTRNILLNAEVPVVEIMNLTDAPIDMCVGLNQRRAGEVLAQHLLSKGYKRFGFLGWNREDFSALARFEAIRNTIRRGGGAVAAPQEYTSPPDFATGKAGLAALLQDQPELDAVFFANDTAATGGMVHCIEAGIDIPKDLALAGFSGLQTGQNMPRKLSTIATKRFETGRVAARGILNRLAGVPTRTCTDMGFELIAGESS